MFVARKDNTICETSVKKHICNSLRFVIYFPGVGGAGAAGVQYPWQVPGGKVTRKN